MEKFSGAKEESCRVSNDISCHSPAVSASPAHCIHLLCPQPYPVKLIPTLMPLPSGPSCWPAPFSGPTSNTHSNASRLCSYFRLLQGS